MRALRAQAPAKINLGLFVGPVRERDGRHELVTVMQSISLADTLTLEAAPAGSSHDHVLCPGVAGENLAARALAAFRERTGWREPPLTLRIEKRIPLAAGLGGGSADAAATLRLAHAASGLGDEPLLLELAIELGADVPAQIAPGRWLASGAGELLEPLPAPSAPLGVLVLPAAEGLSTGAVYGEADRLGLTHTAQTLEEHHEELRSGLARGAPLPRAAELLHNDLQRAAVSLRPELVQTLGQARAAGAEHVLLSGSGPTVLGLFARGEDDEGEGGALARAAAAAGSLAELKPPAVWADTVDAAFAAVAPVDRRGA
jgi:4-diphosphocytidyl-2-C-methyl-D-erythritol kinase